jgi:acetate kinase
MQILVVNSGSSSIKFSVFDWDSQRSGAAPACRIDGQVAGVGGAQGELTLGEATSHVDASSADQAMHAVLDALEASHLPPAGAVGYRVVHPGPKLKGHQRITDAVLAELDRAAVFAPLHDPPVLTIIRAMRTRLPHAQHFACFDTVFHQTMPIEATTYALPLKLREGGVRRYGFHGLSCESIVRRMQAETGGFPRRAVIAHLGSGCSVTALLDGRSVDNSMGLTPAGGVVMGTRPGDLDPGVVLYLLRQETGDMASAVERLLNHDSGMVALSGLANDLKSVREAAAQGNANAQLALQVFTRSVRKAIGSYAWLLGGVDAVIFSGGIGEHDAKTRAEVLKGLEEMSVLVGAEVNAAKELGMRRISGPQSKTEVWVVPSGEDEMIAIHVAAMMLQDESQASIEA